MDFDSNYLVLTVVAVVILVLIRTLIRAGKEINSSDKFPISKNRQDSKRDDENSLQNWILKTMTIEWTLILQYRRNKFFLEGVEF